jgi:hypothetical protein
MLFIFYTETCTTILFLTVFTALRPQNLLNKILLLYKQHA